MRRLDVVVGGQFGSEGKGAVCGALAARFRYDASIRVGGPNAGHTVVDRYGEIFKLRQVPAAVVVDDMVRPVIGPGSEIDLGVLEAEVADLEARGHRTRSRLAIHPQATILEAHHKAAEVALIREIGSTGKGIGAARAERIMRQGKLAKDATGRCIDLFTDPTVTTDDWSVLVEGTQGFGLGLHAGYYPFCTSIDCTAVDALAMAGLSPWDARVRVFLVIRPNPIRVAGNSGPLFDETTWEDLGLEVERTTVTNKVRRVGAWDAALAHNAVRANGGAPTVRLVLTMLDHVFHELGGATTQAVLTGKHRDFIGAIEADCGAPVVAIGTGPSTMIFLQSGWMVDEATADG